MDQAGLLVQRKGPRVAMSLQSKGMGRNHKPTEVEEQENIWSLPEPRTGNFKV